MRGGLARCAAFALSCVFVTLPSHAQQPSMRQDPSLNNLVHAADYKTGPVNELGRVLKRGNGKRDMILIAGAGFDGSVFEPFMKAWEGEYRMFAATLAGFGGTPAPPMPKSGTSYGEQTWTNGAVAGVKKLIEKESIEKPVIVAHLANATQVALKLALEKPNDVAAVILISGMPRFVSPNPQLSPTPATLQERVLTIDQGYAPQWFRTVTRDTWDDNNYLPGDYAQHPLRALQLWRQAAEAPLPVHVRYLCEFLAQDVTLELEGLEVPTLVVKPQFDEAMYVPDGRNYMKAFFQDAWEGVGGQEGSPIQMVSIKNTRAFIMDDQPSELNRVVRKFLSGLGGGD